MIAHTRPERSPLGALAFTLALALLAIPAAADEKAIETENDRVFYALGVIMGRQLSAFMMSPEEFEALQRGVSDAALGKELVVDPSGYGDKIAAVQRERAAKLAEQEKAASKAFLAEQAKIDGAVTKDSGLIYIEESPGTGAAPTPDSVVKVHYHGTMSDGSVFDSSVERGEPATFPLNRVIPCWTEGLQLMKTGGKSVLVCPAEIAYGDRGHPPRIPGGAALRFEVELIEIVQ
jgi:FKBP-type peptidyl-prolyl cis-trans isomerase FkpA